MNNAKILLTVSIFLLVLFSCDEDEVSISRGLVGSWQSTQVDSLFHYVVPEAPDSFFSSDCVSSYLEIREDGSYIMINSEDITAGSWEQSSADSLSLDTKDVHGKILSKKLLEIKYVDKDELVLSSSGGSFSAVWRACDTTMRIVQDTRYEATVHYLRK